MENTENLTAAEAIKKIKDIAGSGEVCFMMTNLHSRHASIRPMSTLRVDENGNIYFFTAVESHKANEIKKSHEAQLTYANTTKSEYMVLNGTAETYRDQLQIDAMWTMFAKTWFPEGKDDPNLSIVKFTPKSGKYWGSKHGKVVQMLGILYGAVTGKQTDDGLSGEIHLSKKTSGNTRKSNGPKRMAKKKQMPAKKQAPAKKQMTAKKRTSAKAAKKANKK